MQPPFRQPLFLVLTAPSGAGKTTLVNLLRAEFPAFQYSVSCTTREPRGEEEDGVDYHFLTQKRFDELVAQGAFLEHATVHGNSYGTLIQPIRDAFAHKLSVLLDIDVAGAAQVREIVRALPPDAPLRRAFLDVFIDVPSLEELRRRLEKRGEDAPDVIETRLRNAEGERAHRNEFAAIVVNDVLETAYAELRALVLDKAKGV